ncbi:MAG: hypothetical protein QM697_03235 [Lachnospiraceae bacterium]
MNQHKLRRRILAMALSAAMILGMMPVSAAAETSVDASGEITAFEALSEAITNRTAALHTSLEDLSLPETLSATVRIAAEADAGDPVIDSGEPATPSEGEEFATEEITVSVPVEWVSAPTYHGDAADSYIFTAAVAGYRVSAQLPQITVTVREEETLTSGEITAFASLDEDTAQQHVPVGTVLAALDLPETLSATLDADAASVPVTWTCAPAYEGNTEREYTFTASLPKAYTLVSGITVPVITVTVGTLPLMGLTVSGNTVTIEETDEISDIKSTIEEVLAGYGVTTVVVIGSKTGVNETLMLDIPYGKTVQWKATFEAASGFSSYLIVLLGEGTFEAATGSTISVTEGNAIYATGTAITSAASEDAHLYWRIYAEYTGVVTQMEGSIEMTENPSKIYDGTAIAHPTVRTNGNGAVTHTYYTGSGTTGTQLSGLPQNAGTYTVVAKMAETLRYTEALSQPLIFAIEQRSVSLGLSARKESGQTIIMATVMGAVDAEGQIRFEINGSEAELVNVTESGGVYSAELGVSSASIPADTYQVSAYYLPGVSANYQCVNSPVSATYASEKAYREITTEAVPALTYGDNSFNLNAGTGNSTADDQYSYAVVHDEYLDLPDAASVNGSGTVSVNNAGVTIIKITLADGTGYYNDAVKYVPIVVHRAQLHVESYAERSGIPITQAGYGTLDELTYGLRYKQSDFKNGDTALNFTRGNGTLVAAPLDPMLDVTGSYNSIGISEVGADFVIGGLQYENVFLCRNYEIVYTYGEVMVTATQLQVRADAATGQWHLQPSYTYTVSGLARWDTQDGVFVTQPVASMDTTKTLDLPYDSLEPGYYVNAVTVTQGTLSSNSSGLQNYIVHTYTADLIIGKADASLAVSTQSKVYDGSPVNVTVQTPNNYIGAAPVVRYYAAGQPLAAAPISAGAYYVEVTVQESQRYKAETVLKHLYIWKATPNPGIPVLPNMQIQKGLTLAQQALPSGWTWIDSDQALEVGTVRELALYTPQDTVNYQNVYAYLTFDVTALPETPDPTPNLTLTPALELTFDVTAVLETPDLTPNPTPDPTFDVSAVPVNPESPPDPTSDPMPALQPDEPDNGGEGENGDGQADNVQASKDLATGNSQNSAIWIVLSFVSVAGILGIMIKKKKCKKR